MLSSLGFLIISAFIALYELSSLLTKKLYKESIAFCFLLFIGTLMGILFLLGIPLPNPSNWLITIIKPLTNMMNYLLK